MRADAMESELEEGELEEQNGQQHGEDDEGIGSFSDSCPQERDELGLKNSYDILGFATWIKDNFGFDLIKLANVTWHTNKNEDISPPAKAHRISECSVVYTVEDVSLSSISSTDSTLSKPLTSTPVTPASRPRKPPPPPLMPYWQPRDFTSRDAIENADNDNPEWEDLRKTSTNEERINFAALKFGNRHPADPTCNLTFYGFRRRNRRGHGSIMDFRIIRTIENGKIIKLSPTEYSFRGNRKRGASSLFDDRDVVPAKRPRFDEMVRFDSFAHVLESTLHEFKGRDRFWPFLKRHLKASMRESFAFVKYYTRYNEEPMISKNDQTSILDRENIYRRFVGFYGRNQIVFCKECRAEHPF